MPNSIRNRWLLALAAAVVVALAITAILSRKPRQAARSGEDPIAVWKARTGVDLPALPRLHPPHPDSDAAMALDALVQPIGLRLGEVGRGPQELTGNLDEREEGALRDALRAAIRSETTEPKPLPPAAAAAIERRAQTLDAVAEFVAGHDDIRWNEDFGPRSRSSTVYTADHLTLHRLLIGRAFQALERRDTSTAERMLSASQRLHRLLLERQELRSQFAASGVERMHLALLRHAGGALTTPLAAPDEGIRERYLSGMSAEALVALTNTRELAMNRDDDPAVVLVRALAGSKLDRAANEAVTFAANGVGEIMRSQDGCAELAKNRRGPDGLFSDEFFLLNAKESWRVFVVLELDRALTAAVLTGKTSSPCPSVTITVRDEGPTRTVTAMGLPAESDSVVGLPSVVTTRLDRP